MLLKNASSVRIDLALEDDFMSRSFEPKINAPYAREQAADLHGFVCPQVGQTSCL
jgi:hypothetical protein